MGIMNNTMEPSTPPSRCMILHVQSVFQEKKKTLITNLKLNYVRRGVLSDERWRKGISTI